MDVGAIQGLDRGRVVRHLAGAPVDDLRWPDCGADEDEVAVERHGWSLPAAPRRTAGHVDAGDLCTGRHVAGRRPGSRPLSVVGVREVAAGRDRSTARPRRGSGPSFVDRPVRPETSAKWNGAPPSDAPVSLVRTSRPAEVKYMRLRRPRPSRRRVAPRRGRRCRRPRTPGRRRRGLASACGSATRPSAGASARRDRSSADGADADAPIARHRRRRRRDLRDPAAPADASAGGEGLAGGRHRDVEALGLLVQQGGESVSHGCLQRLALVTETGMTASPSRRRRVSRALEVWLLTVPSEQPRAWAVSATDRSS